MLCIIIHCTCIVFLKWKINGIELNWKIHILATIEVKMAFLVCYYQIIMFLHITLSSQLSVEPLNRAPKSNASFGPITYVCEIDYVSGVIFAYRNWDTKLAKNNYFPQNKKKIGSRTSVRVTTIFFYLVNYFFK